MSRNVEIKAKVEDSESIILKARELCEGKESQLKQEDHYFHTPEGRLKLRFINDTSAELIYYDRPNSTGPKLSKYKKVSVPHDGQDLLSILETIATKRGVVKKIRQLFLVGQTRVHVDSVKELGSFVELEVVLKENETVDEGTLIAHDLMDKLGIPKDNLLPNSYIDLLHPLP